MRQPNKFGKALISLLGLMLAVLMTVEVAHSHPDLVSDTNTPTHCQICAVAHVAIASQPAWLTTYVLNMIGTITIGEPRSGTRPVIRVAFIRPPPLAGSSLA